MTPERFQRILFEWSYPKIARQCREKRRPYPDLGEDGQMVKEFDTVVFSGEPGEIHGPVKIQFGYHLIDIAQRS